MKYNFYIILIVAFFVKMQNGFTQPYNSTGETLNLALLAKTPQKIKLSQRSFMSLPESYSLEKYCPTPGNQGHFGTCTAWASAYGVATILYAKTHNITDQAMINKYAFSPSFLYNLIKNSTDESCKEGSSTIDALNKLTQLGDALLTTVPYGCNVYVSDAARAEAANYKINDGIVLFAARGLFEADKFYKPAEEAIELVKKSLTEGSPVSISIRLPESFQRLKTAVWTPDPNENIADSKWEHNLHAMCIIGYDDKIESGAFRVLNSWGTDWGDGGKIWIKYADFAKWALMALQPYGNPYTKEPDEFKKADPTPEPTPVPKPEPKPDPVPVPVPKPQPTPDPKPSPEPKPKPIPIINNELSGSIEFKLNSGDDMPVNRISSRNLVVEEEKAAKEDLVAYTMMNSYTSGTKFRFYMNIDKEAYIYAFATDLSGKINKILPFDDLTSTHVGSNTVVAFPSDTKIIKLDETRGVDYLLILYSKEKLNMDDMLAAMTNKQGGLSAKIISALGSKLTKKEDVKYSSSNVGFTVNDNAGGSVVPIMVEIKHN